jgi:hypothetical protein
VTHEAHLSAVREVFAARLNEPERCLVHAVKLVYGSGQPQVYGTCFYDAWQADGPRDVIEIAASGEDSLLQLWITLAHEIAHVLAGYAAGHGRRWREAANRIGLLHARASGPIHRPADLHPDVLAVLRQLPMPTDGRPAFTEHAGPVTPRPCPAGIGVAGGTSRGPGSGSRLRLYECNCQPPVKVRVARDSFHARCLVCDAEFKRAAIQSTSE